MDNQIKTIEEVKKYLRDMRSLVNEKKYLKLEYEELLLLTSPLLDGVKTNNKLENTHMNSLIIKREII